MSAALGVVVGRLNKRLSALIPILSICSSSEGDRVHDSQLLMRLGITLFSYRISRTLAATPRMTSDDAVVFIWRIVLFILFYFASKFILFLLLFVTVSKVFVRCCILLSFFLLNSIQMAPSLSVPLASLGTSLPPTQVYSFLQIHLQN